MSPWYLTPPSLEQLVSLRADPPRMMERLAPLSQWMRGRETEWVHDPEDERVDALRRLSDAAFIEAEARGDRKALRGPRVCEVVAAAINGGRSKLARDIAAALALATPSQRKAA